jgi:hypothetical protein
MIPMVLQILDLRERGSETVSHSEGTGIAAFTTKYGSSAEPGSPFAAYQRYKNRDLDRSKGRGMVSTVNSAVMLSTMGSVVVDADQDSDSVDMVRMQGLGIAIGRTSTKNIGEGDKVSQGRKSYHGHDQEIPAPTYHAVELEMGFRTARPSIDTTPGVSGIRVDVEKTTSTM